LIAEQREKANAEEFEKKRQDRIRRIREKIARGIGLGKGDREFVKLNNEMVKRTRQGLRQKLAAAKEREKTRKESGKSLERRMHSKGCKTRNLPKLKDIDGRLVFLKTNLMALPV